MKQWKRLAFYLILNIIVSVCVTLGVLLAWDYFKAPSEPLAMVADTTEALESGSAPTSTSPVSQITETPGTPVLDIPQNVDQYEVEFGDTLGLIAERFDVSVEDLMELNALKDPNSLSVGMIIYVPLPASKRPTPTQGATNTPSGPTNTPSGPPVEAGVIINSVIGVGDIASEHVFISRTGDGELSLAEWRLEDEDGNVYVFPMLSLFERGAVNVWTKLGANTVVDVFWGLQSPVWERGEQVTLRDAQGAVRATYTIP